MHVSVIVQAYQASESVRITFNGPHLSSAGEHPVLKFAVYLDGALVASGSGREDLDRALGALRELIDRELLRKLASLLLELAVLGPFDVMAKEGRAGLMVCETGELELRGAEAFQYFDDFILERGRGHQV